MIITIGGPAVNIAPMTAGANGLPALGNAPPKFEIYAADKATVIVPATGYTDTTGQTVTANGITFTVVAAGATYSLQAAAGTAPVAGAFVSFSSQSLAQQYAQVDIVAAAVAPNGQLRNADLNNLGAPVAATDVVRLTDVPALVVNNVPAAAATAKTEQVSATAAGQTVFNCANVYTRGMLQVFLRGSLLRPATDYAVSSSTGAAAPSVNRITLTAAAAMGLLVNDVVGVLGLP